MGLVNLLSMKEDGTASMDYDLQLYGAADEIVQKAAAVLINRLPADFAVVVAKDIIKCAPLFARNPAFLDFVRAHKECFL